MNFSLQPCPGVDLDPATANALSARTLLSGVIGPRAFNVIESWLMARRGEAHTSPLNGPLYEDIVDMVESALVEVVTSGKRYPVEDGRFEAHPPTADTVLRVYEAIGFYLRASRRPHARGIDNLPSTSAIVLIHWLIEVKEMQAIDRILALDMIRRHSLAVSEATLVLRSRASARRANAKGRPTEPRNTGFEPTTASGDLDSAR